MLLFLLFEECTSSLFPQQNLASQSTITKKRYRLQRLLYASICGIAIINRMTSQLWRGTPWDGMGQSKLPWDRMGMGRDNVSHGQPCHSFVHHMPCARTRCPTMRVAVASMRNDNLSHALTLANLAKWIWTSGAHDLSYKLVVISQSKTVTSFAKIIDQIFS